MSLDIVPESHRDLVSNESKAIAYLATTLPSGAPIISPVWFGVVGGHIAFFTGDDTLKSKNMKAQPEVSLLLQDPEDQYRYVQIRGRYVESDPEGAREFLDMLSRRYTGDDYPDGGSDQGVIVKIKPERVNVFSWTA